MRWPGYDDSAVSDDKSVTVNGERRPVPAGGNLATLLAELDVTPQTKGVAVAVNDELVPRANWASTPLQPNDRVEVVRAVQGG